MIGTKLFYFQCDTVYPQKFVNYDLNDDKKITLEELAETANCTKGEMSSVFDKTDTNGNTFKNILSNFIFEVTIYTVKMV